ncbi:MAG: ABC transporter substrate-binding protein [Sphingomonas fennica]
MLKVMWFVPPALHRLAECGGRLAAGAVDAASTGSSDEQFERLQQGRCDAVVTAMDNVVMWNRRPASAGYWIAAQIETTTAISLVAAPGFATVADLRGARLLVDSAVNGFVIALRALLDDAGIGFGDCAVIEAGGVRERFADLTRGEGDASLLGPPFVGMAEAQGLRRLADLDSMFPGFPGQGIVVRRDIGGETRARTVAWLAALEAARADARADEARAVRALLAAGMEAPLATTMARTVPAGLIPDPAGVALIVRHRAQLGLPGGGDRYEELVDPGLLVDALAQAAIDPA